LSAPAAETAARARGTLSRPALTYLVLAVTLAVFTNLAIFQALLPVEIAHSHGSALAVGEATSLFSAGTVASEVLMVFLATRLSMSHLLAFGALVMGAATLGYLLAGHSVPALLVLTTVRGAAFGINVVTTSYLVAAYSDPSQRGRALGVYGFCVSLPAAFGISLGLVIQSTRGPGLAYVAGALPAVIAGAGFAAVLARSSPPAVVPPTIRVDHLPRLLPTAVAISLVTMTYGGLLSFGPALVGSGAAVLFLGFGIARAASRPFAGVLCDRIGAPPVLAGSLILLAAGCGILAIGSGFVVAAMAGSLYGIGLGGVSNAAYVVMLDRSEDSGQALVSASWSTAFDSGVVVGGITFAAVAQAMGVRTVALLLPVVASVPLLLPLVDRAAAGRLGSRA
jgi:MFS family permease